MRPSEDYAIIGTVGIAEKPKKVKWYYSVGRQSISAKDLVKDPPVG